MKCTQCSAEIKKGTGTMYVYKTGTINYFCSKRCFRNHSMKRKTNKKELKRK